MKKLFRMILTSFVLVNSGLTAYSSTDYIDIEDLSQQEITEDNESGPFSFEISGDYIGKANFSCKDFRHFTFATANADLSFVCYYNPCINEAANIGVSYTFTQLDWQHNPFFTQKNINTASINLGAFTERLQDWTWRAQASINFDNLEYWNVTDYMNYDLLLWGRYAYTPSFGVHIGALALTGMKIDRLYPIIGIDWTYNCHWKLNLVFPTDLSVVYTIDECWSIALAARTIIQRHRVNKDQFLSEGLWLYTSSGAELAVEYNPAKWISVNVHAGTNFGGHLKIADRHYHNGHRLRFESAPYAGAEIDLNF